MGKQGLGAAAGGIDVHRIVVAHRPLQQIGDQSVAGCVVEQVELLEGGRDRGSWSGRVRVDAHHRKYAPNPNSISGLRGLPENDCAGRKPPTGRGSSDTAGWIDASVPSSRRDVRSLATTSTCS